ncbi:hypothetical protein [Micromonospora sp. CB01531]|nr:hypothetical protein [Micromonospora sp. CB01531]
MTLLAASAAAFGPTVPGNRQLGGWVHRRIDSLGATQAAGL